jgi:hypothetical protein
VTIALRTPWDLPSYPSARTHICSYGILPPTMEAVAAALVGEIPFSGRLPVQWSGCTARSRAVRMSVRDEILEQPAAATRLLDAAPASFAPISAAVRARRPALCRHCRPRQLGQRRHLRPVPAGRAQRARGRPCRAVDDHLYGARPDMADALVVGISQSGRSPDIVAVVDEARRQGALTVALTNDQPRRWPIRRSRRRSARRPGAGDGRHQDLHGRTDRCGVAIGGH